MYQDKIKNLKYFYNYDQYISDLEAKKKRTGTDATDTVCDFFTDEEIKAFNEKGISDLTPFLPISEEIKQRRAFAIDLVVKLKEKHPDDEWLKFLGSPDGVQYLCCTNWYEEYKEIQKAFFGDKK
ncbi:MAG: hypothetical protein WCY75_06940 [Sulfurimonadaceae bacterium]